MKRFCLSVLALPPLLAVTACGVRTADNVGAVDAGDSGDLPVMFAELDFAPPPPPPCEGTLKCKQVNCGELASTTLTGRVFAPNGTLPIYNAVVYVPDAPLERFAPGVSCDVCGAKASGKPIVVALTDPKGKFRLENVPAGDDIPLVIQIGRWRRQVTIPKIVACSDNVLDPVKDVNLQRLPRRHTEGDIPHIAVATGTYDPVECLLRKIGIADSEFTAPTEKGRVHLYKQDGTDLTAPLPSAQTLYDDLATLKTYDMIFLPCSAAHPTAQQAHAMLEYTTAGGRLFATDLMQSWLQAVDEWKPPITWGSWSPGNPFTATVDLTFPKGQAFSKWLTNVGAAAAPNQVVITQPYGRVLKVARPVQRWLYGVTQNGEPPMHFSFNSPIIPPPVDGGEALQCGRVLFSSFHVSASDLAPGPRIFPQVCKADPLTVQEKVLAFMIFDLSSCVQKDEDPPIPPIP